VKFFCLALLLFSAALFAAALCSASDAPAPPANASYSAAGLYNLANSYARAGKPGLAVLNYERAGLLAPNDADIQANLKQLRSSLHLPTARGGSLERIARVASPSSVAWIGILGVLLLGSSLMAAGHFLRLKAAWISAGTLGIAAIGFTVCNAAYWYPKAHAAVVISTSTTIRAKPVPMGDPLQELSEAEIVTIAQSHEEFVLVRTAGGRSGWVARADLADVVPETAVR
jgi:uncharacterized protein YgiM (DUF1202 family)